jgi:hypothetical protein
MVVMWMFWIVLGCEMNRMESVVERWLNCSLDNIYCNGPGF